MLPQMQQQLPPRAQSATGIRTRPMSGHPKLSPAGGSFGSLLGPSPRSSGRSSNKISSRKPSERSQHGSRLGSGRNSDWSGRSNSTSGQSGFGTEDNEIYRGSSRQNSSRRSPGNRKHSRPSTAFDHGRLPAKVNLSGNGLDAEPRPSSVVASLGSLISADDFEEESEQSYQKTGNLAVLPLPGGGIPLARPSSVGSNPYGNLTTTTKSGNGLSARRRPHSSMMPQRGGASQRSRGGSEDSGADCSNSQQHSKGAENGTDSGSRPGSAMGSRMNSRRSAGHDTQRDQPRSKSVLDAPSSFAFKRPQPVEEERAFAIRRSSGNGDFSCLSDAAHHVKQLKQSSSYFRDLKRKNKLYGPNNLKSIESEHSTCKWLLQRKRLVRTPIDPPTKKSIAGVFRIMDEDGGGDVSVDEIIAIFPVLGLSAKRSEVQRIVNQIDRQRKGSLDFEQFATLMTMALENAPGVESWLRTNDAMIMLPALAESYRTRRDIAHLIFNVVDGDGSGNIDQDELQLALTHLGFKMSDKEVATLIHDADATGDGDGEVNFDEFMYILTHLDTSNPNFQLRQGLGNNVATLMSLSQPDTKIVI